MSHPKIGQEEALHILNEWLNNKGYDTSNSTLDQWGLSTYRDTHTFASEGSRMANTVYLVRKNQVAVFTPSGMVIEEAYLTLK